MSQGFSQFLKTFSLLVGTQHLCKGHLEWVMTLSRKGRLLKSITVSCTCCTTGLDQETAFFWPFGLWLAWRLVRTNWCGPFVIQPTTLLFVLSSIHTGTQTSGLKNLPRIYHQVMFYISQNQILKVKISFRVHSFLNSQKFSCNFASPDWYCNTVYIVSHKVMPINFSKAQHTHIISELNSAYSFSHYMWLIDLKGQLISEWLFGVSNFPKNQRKKFLS